MGHYQWMAVKGRENEDVFADLELVDMGEPGDFDRSPYTYVETSKGWLVLVSDARGFIGPERLAKVSAGGEAVGLWASETVMANTLAAYRDGVEAWTLDYDCGHEPRSVVVKGSPPPEFAEANARGIAEDGSEEGVDYIFEVIPRPRRRSPASI